MVESVHWKEMRRDQVGRVSSPQARTAEVIHKTTQEKPFNATHWSTRTMASATRLSETPYGRIEWHQCG
jgi:hypothetical protein